jgi:ankyrin repeat protein
VGKSALHWAAQFGESRLLHELLRSVVDNNAVDGAGNTPLHLAALNGHLCALSHVAPLLNSCKCCYRIVDF